MWAVVGDEVGEIAQWCHAAMRSGFRENGNVTSWSGDERAMEEDGQPSLRPVASYLQYGWRPFDFLPDLIKGSLSRRPPPGGGPTLTRKYRSSPLLVISFCPWASKSTTCVPVLAPAGLPTLGPGLRDGITLSETTGCAWVACHAAICRDLQRRER